MNEPDQNEISTLLREALPPMNTELRRDLWPTMLRRLEQPSARTAPWYDWALAGSVAVVLCLFPQLFLLLAYHL